MGEERSTRKIGWCFEPCGTESHDIYKRGQQCIQPADFLLSMRRGTSIRAWGFADLPRIRLYSAKVRRTKWGRVMPMRGSLAHQLDDVQQPGIFDLMGQGAYVQHVARQIQRVARTNFTVIVQGETGTGKELVAQFIHAHSERRGKPFVAVDCGAIPEGIVESELFGHARGAFTGANSKKAGYFEMAKGGTLFLDEIANLPLHIQTKLLRSMQERTVLPLGGEQSIQTDVRVIVASNVVLEEAVRAGGFRHDLFHRLNEFKVYLLPLREHREDILSLAERFRQEANTELQKRVWGFTAEAKTFLLSYAWPGNVRELRNTVRRAVLLSSDTIEGKHLRQGRAAWTGIAAIIAAPTLPSPYDGRGLHDVISEAVARLEKTLIQQILQETLGNKTKTAERLKIGYKTLFRKLKEYDIA